MNEEMLKAKYSYDDLKNHIAKSYIKYEIIKDELKKINKSLKAIKEMIRE